MNMNSFGRSSRFPVRILDKRILVGTRVQFHGENLWYIVSDISPQRRTFAVQKRKSVFFPYEIQRFTNVPPLTSI